MEAVYRLNPYKQLTRDHREYLLELATDRSDATKTLLRAGIEELRARQDELEKRGVVDVAANQDEMATSLQKVARRLRNTALAYYLAFAPVTFQATEMGNTEWLTGLVVVGAVAPLLGLADGAEITHHRKDQRDMFRQANDLAFSSFHPGTFPIVGVPLFGVFGTGSVVYGLQHGTAGQAAAAAVMAAGGLGYVAWQHRQIRRIEEYGRKGIMPFRFDDLEAAQGVAAKMTTNQQTPESPEVKYEVDAALEKTAVWQDAVATHGVFLREQHEIAPEIQPLSRRLRRSIERRQSYRGALPTSFLKELRDGTINETTQMLELSLH